MRERPKFDGRTLKRLLSYMRAYKGTLVLVTVCILLSAVAGAASSMFLQKLIDGYIVPMLGTASPDYSGLIRALITIGCVYLVGTLATWLYNRRMVTIAQGTLKRIRDEMFEKMQSLPIRYFDTHTHGDIMSLYTNDTDTLRQMIAQSMAQLVSSVFTLAAVFFCMLYISVWLTLIVCAVMALILVFVRKLTGRIGGYFMAQQTALADLNGYVEEMVNGQKVVKVFCHEEQSKAELRRRNRVWAENAARASGMANSMMPMMNAVGYLQYVIIAVIGGTMAISGTPNLGLTGMNTLTLGMIASFLTLSRGFTNPISQISNQFNSIVTALAGASRIFAFMDAEPETDDGYVTLVNATEENGMLAETDHRTGLWAWKHPHGDGTVTYTKLAGRVVFDHVDFGYTPDKEVLHDITLYAEPGQKVAFVGATGAGKTTITNLINRFYDIADGKIRYDGININKIKKAVIKDKGVYCNGISCEISRLLQKGGVPTHFIEQISDTEQLCWKSQVIPMEVIVRNVIAGSMAQRLGLEEGIIPKEPIYDLCYKSDILCDPIINDYHAVALGLVSKEELERIYSLTKQVNSILTPVFKEIGITLVDFKIEFGHLSDGRLVMSDDITPDSARFWDIATGERLDKDRFRRDNGHVGEAYRTVYERLTGKKSNLTFEICLK